jgi:hypothetical protein
VSQACKACSSHAEEHHSYDVDQGVFHLRLADERDSLTTSSSGQKVVRSFRENSL